MVSEIMDLQGVPQPKMDWEATNLPEAWKRFQQHVALIFAGPLKDKDEATQCTYLLLWVGDKGRDIFNTWGLSDDDQKKLKCYYDGYKSYVQPKLNPIFARFKFNNEVQGPSTIESYVTRLRLLAKDCSYTNTDEMIRDRIVFGTSSPRVREKLINEGEKLTLDKAIQIAQTFEYSQNQLKLMQAEISVAEPQKSVNAVSSGRHGNKNKNFHKQKKQQQKHGAVDSDHKQQSGAGRGRPKGGNPSMQASKCGNCGFEHSKSGHCPAQGKQCDKCRKWNHFAKMCRSKTVNEMVIVSQPDYDLGIGDDFCIDSISSNLVNDQAFTKIKLGPNSYPVNLKIDTGSQVNILPRSTLGQLGKCQVTPDSLKLSAYDGHPLDIVGKCQVECKYDGKLRSLSFHVVDTNSPPLLGLRSSLELGLVKFAHTVEAHTSTNVPPVSSPPLKPEVPVKSQAMSKESTLQEYGDVFQGVGLLPGECVIQTDPTVPPVVHAPRRVPFAIRDKLKAELDRMEKAEIITKVSEPTRWVNSLVVVEKPKSGKLRICLDPVDLNKAINRPHYPMRTLDDVLPDLTGAKYFTKLDARSGYWNVKLAEESSYLTTFNSPFGRYRFLRLPFGLKSSQDEFQKKIDECYEGLSGVVAIVDDILVFGETREVHDANLRRVLDRSRGKGIKLNEEKLDVGVTEVEYFGHILSSEGLKPDPAKVTAIVQMKPPQNRAELETILGMINYLAKFAPDLSNITTPMRKLLKKDTEFLWDSPQQESFEKVKRVITRSPGPVLTYFNPKEPVTLQVDASKYGLGAALLQSGRPVAYASKTLTPCEINYAQIEKEMYAILFGCTRFHQYLYGREVDVESDHKPLVSIMVKPLYVAPPRLQRMLLQLQKYDLNVQHVPGKQIPLADTLSRKFLPDTYPNMSEGIDMHVHTVLDMLPVNDCKLHEIRVATSNDPDMCELVEVVRRGWPEKRYSCPSSVLEYWNFRDQVTVNEGIVMKSQKVVIPRSLRQEMMDKVHSGHMGVDKCLQRARDVIFWPKMSSDITDMVLKCTTCLERRNSNPKEPILPRAVPEYPWQTIATDLFSWNEQDFIVAVDYYSRFFEVERLSNTHSSTVIQKLKGIFARYGIPQVVVSDNGPQYSSEEFRKFAKVYDFQHETSSPHHPASNGLAEKYVQIVKRILSKAKADNRDPYLAMLEYRTSPVCGSYSPSQLLMGRKLRSVLPITTTQLKPRTPDPEHVRANIQASRTLQKKYHDARSVPLKPLHVGDPIRIQQANGLWKPGMVTQKHSERSYIVSANDGGTYRRNRQKLLASREPQFSPPSVLPEPDCDYQSTQPPPIANSEPSSKASPTPSEPVVPAPNAPYITRSGRVVKAKVIESM